MTLRLPHIPAGRALIGAALVAALSACSAQSIRQDWMNRESGSVEVFIPEGSYKVAFLPLASPPGRQAEAWVFGPGVSAPFTMSDGGVPGLRVSRLDGQAMTRADHQDAVAAASAGCSDRPGWTPSKAAAIARPVAREDATRYYGTGYLTGGAWVLLGVCK
ncbi:hypothetical protein OB2597_00280 [Pseudooceanicola batsensis HTCC2597]|uniref:Lipoprotein n=1 Tax=Pseudooceanicola batsensis (strain ATCC BAA-863 / DSM 15984 / KCTC 12145 / HTCC2597) TaxID=252305 RepID=A3U1M6_PSEBH|nr:hypothetical protein [Pseudooceanicola batsensis]EAQ01807.1 hypothetical protein OB2597_00280 [Pseudooceanicola batsensis HTCC2597]